MPEQSKSSLKCVWRFRIYLKLNCFVDWLTDETAISLTSNRDQYMRFSPSQTSDPPRAGFRSGTSTEYELRLFLMNLGISDKHYTTSHFPNQWGMYIVEFGCILLNFVVCTSSTLERCTIGEIPQHNLFYNLYWFWFDSKL